MYRLVLLGLFLLTSAASAQEGPTHDQEITWRTYAAEQSARVRVFLSPDDRRPRTVVVDDRAGNRDAITDDAQFVADHIGRELGFDPVEATFVFRYTPASFVAEAGGTGKTLLLKATFRRTSTGALAAPDWRVISSDTLEDLTDRAMR
ncbi:MAG: hypothetical protein AAGK21_07835 [Bacteroidota bacterium]